MQGKILTAALAAALEIATAHPAHGRAGLFWRLRPPAVFASVTGLSVSPPTVSFLASNPSQVTVSGSSTATVSWTMANSIATNNWTLNVQAAANTFTGCSTAPVAAVQAACAGASAGASCAGSAVPLSTSPQAIASGKQANGTYSITINFTLAESWRYVANSACTIIITYSINAP